MDFLRIRKKARERAASPGPRPERPPGGADVAARPDREPAAEPPPGPEPGPPAGPQRIRRGGSSPRTGRAAHTSPDPPPSGHAAQPGPLPASDGELLEGALAARLQGSPAGSDGRFTTWRPGTGAPPAIDPNPPAPVEAPRPSDFALVRPPDTSAREPFRPMAPRPARSAPPARPMEAGDPLDAFFYRPDEDAPAVPGFEGGPEAEVDVGGEADVREEYITFLLGGEEYAVAIERVREVLRCPPLTEVPRAPAHVRGVVSVRGEVVAVVEPRRRLGLPEAGHPAEESRLLVVDVGDGPVGLLVDAVSNVVRLRPGAIEPCPHGIGGQSQEFLAGIGRERDRLFTVLDLGALLRRIPAGSRRRTEGGTRAG